MRIPGLFMGSRYYAGKGATHRMEHDSHYLYVVECVDGSLYTGYAVDVPARVAAHNTGKGAKYTRARRPVKLLAQARFDSKSRAMSAEYHFKRLSRDQKDALLARAATEPFEQVLERLLPGLKGSVDSD